MSIKNREVKAEEIERYVRSKINYSFNKEVFENQLTEQVQKNLVKMEGSLVKQMKRKLLLQQHEKKDLQRRSQLKSSLQTKLKQSETKRMKRKEEKVLSIKKQREYKENQYLQRITDIKKTQKEKALKKIKELDKEDRKSPVIYNKIEHAVSLLDEPHYRKKLCATEQEYENLKKIVESKKAFEKPKTHTRQLSLTQIKPRIKDSQLWQKQKISKMGEHLNRIEEGRKKKHKMLQEKVKKSKQIQDYSRKTNMQKLAELKEREKNKKKELKMKLQKPIVKTQRYGVTKSYSQLHERIRESEDPQYSILYEQGHEREKYSYRKDIKDQIREYMIKEKHKIMASH